MEVEGRSIQIVALGWDRFGGRCNEMLNSLLISKVIGCDFKFVWPAVDQEILANVNDQIAYFSPDFLRNHRCDSVNDAIYELETGAEKSRDDLVQEIVKSGFQNFKLANWVERSIPLVKGVDTQALYASLSETIWSKEAKKVKLAVSLIFEQNEVKNSIHIRSGDLLNGAWRQYPDIAKYIPVSVLYIHLENYNSEKLAILSDTPEISNVASQKFRNTVSNFELREKLGIEDFYNDLQDLFIMSLSEKVLAPSLSVFSMLGARLGGFETELIYQNFSEDDWMDAFKLSLESQTYEDFNSETAISIQARDIAWLVDRLLSQLNIEDFDKATDISASIEDNFVIGLSQRAIALIARGEFSEAEKFSILALSMAEPSLTVHGDPSYYALVTKLVVNLLHTLCSLTVSKVVLENIQNQFSLTFNQTVFQIPKWSVIDPKLLEAQQKFGEFVLAIEKHLNEGIILNIENIKLLKIKVLAEFNRRLFDNDSHKHFLIKITSALTATIDVALNEVLQTN